MVTDLPAVYKPTAAIFAAYDFYHAFITEAYGGFMLEKWSQMTQPFAFHQAAFLLTISSAFNDHHWAMTSGDVEWLIIFSFANCKVSVSATIF